MSKQITIRVAESTSSSSCCCVANFPGGLPSSLRGRAASSEERSSSARRRDAESDVPRFAVRATSKKGKGSGNSNKGSGPLVVVGKDSTCYYAGNVVDASRSKLCVGVYDKQTSTLTLYPAATANLQQSVIQYQQKSANSASGAAAGAAPAQVTKQTLLEEFGSVKKQRVYKSQEANRVHLENVVGSTVEQFLDRSGSGGDNSKNKKQPIADEPPYVDPVERATWEWRRAFLPPFDVGATDPIRVYKMEEFAGRDAWRLVGHRASALLKDKDLIRNATADASMHDKDSKDAKKAKVGDAESYLPSTLSSLKYLLLQQHGDSKMYQVKCALLYQYLAGLYLQLNRRKFVPAIDSNKPAFFGAPIEVAQLFLDKFATSIQNGGRDGHVMSKANLDKCRMHLMLLYVASQDCSQVPVADAAADLRLDLKVATHLLRLSGCTADKKRGSNEPQATLAVPLTFPPATGKRKRGGSGR